MRFTALLFLALGLSLSGCSVLAVAGGTISGASNVKPDSDYGFVTFGPQMRSLTRGRQFRWGYHNGDGFRYDQNVDTRWELRHEGRLLGRYIKGETISETETSGPSLSYMEQSFEHVQRARTNPPSAELPVYRDDLEDGTYTVNRIIRADADNGGNRTFSATFEIRDGEFVPYSGDTPKERGGRDVMVFYPFPKVSS